MPLARKLRKKKLYRRLLFCAFQPDHYDNKLQAYPTLARACFYKGYISRKSSSLLSVICTMRDSLTHTDPCRKRKWNCMKLQAMKKSNRNSSYFLFISWASSLKGFWNSTLVPMFQGNLIALDHSVRIFFFFLQLQRYKVKVFYYLHYNARNLWVFLVSHIFIN